MHILAFRHGRSWENHVNHLIRTGRHHEITANFFDQPDDLCPLHPDGEEEVEQLGQRVRQIIGKGRVLAVSSSYLRAHSSGIAVLPETAWIKDVELRERDYGPVNVIKRLPEVAHTLFGPDGMYRQAHLDPDYRPLEVGETFHDLFSRTSSSFSRWEDEAWRQRVDFLVLSLHGEVMRAGRAYFLEIEPAEYTTHFPDKICNGQLDIFQRLGSQTHYQTICL